MGEIVDILAVLPLGHALVMMASFVLLPHAMRVADEEGANLLLLTKLDHLPGPLVAQVAYTALDPFRHLVLGTLKLFPAAGVLLATCLFLRKLPVSHVALPLETTDTTP